MYCCQRSDCDAVARPCLRRRVTVRMRMMMMQVQGCTTLCSFMVARYMHAYAPTYIRTSCTLYCSNSVLFATLMVPCYCAEHMLFMGSKGFPDENEVSPFLVFQANISDYNNSSALPVLTKAMSKSMTLPFDPAASSYGAVGFVLHGLYFTVWYSTVLCSRLMPEIVTHPLVSAE